MMLEALVALAERKGLLEDTSYGKRLVHYQLRISDDGLPLALVRLGEEGKGLRLDTPAAPKKSVNIKSAFLVETAQYMLGFAKRSKGREPDGKAVTRAPKCLSAFASEVRAASTATGDAGLVAVERFLGRLESNHGGELACQPFARRYLTSLTTSILNSRLNFRLCM